MMKRKNLFLALLLCLPMVVQGNTGVSSTDVSSTAVEQKSYGISLSSTINSNLTKPESYHHNVSAAFALSGNYTFKNKLTLTLSGGLDKELDGLLHEKIRDTYLGLSRQIMKSNNVWSMTGKVGFVFPTDEDKRDFDTFRGSIRGATTLSYKFDKLRIKGLAAAWTFGVNRNFYQYTHGRRGINAQFGMNNSASLSYKVSNVSFSTSFGYSQNWSYSNQRLPDSYSLGAAASYQPKGDYKWLNVTAGYMNGGSAFNPNGTDANIELFDSLTSTVYLSLAASY